MSDTYTLVFYYVPEDLDLLSTPNAYAIPKPLDAITLQDIEKMFPLNTYEAKRTQSENPFHFRFKYKYNGNSVWLDVNNQKIKVPKCDGKIIMKVTRKIPKDMLQTKKRE